MRRSPIGLATLVVALAAAPAAGAAEGRGSTSPSYPGNELRVKAPERIVGGSVLTDVRLAGIATWNENPTSASTTGYTFSLYVQDPTADPTCSPTVSEQRQKSINADVNGTTGPSGFVVDDGLGIGPAVPASQATYSQRVPGFVVDPGLRSVLLCAYQRYVIDHVAAYSARVAVESARCRFRESSVRRGRALRVRCNVRGPLQVRLKRAGKTRTLKGTVSSKGTKDLSSKALAKGTYRASFSSRGQPLGAQRVRIR